MKIKKIHFVAVMFVLAVLLPLLVISQSSSASTIASESITTPTLTVGSGGINFSDSSVMLGAPTQTIKNFTVAAGQTVSAGDVVSIFNGTVSKGVGLDKNVFNSNNMSDAASAAMLNSTQFVIAFRDESNGGYGTALIGTVSGNTISFGEKYVFKSMAVQWVSLALLNPTKFIVTYYINNDSVPGSIIGDISGTEILYGSEYIFDIAMYNVHTVLALSDTKFAVVYTLGYLGNGRGIIGDVSGNVITYGSTYDFNAASTDGIGAIKLTPTKFAVAFKDIGNSNYGTAIIGNVSNNVITFGSEYVYNSGTTDYNTVAYLGPTEFAIVYKDTGAGGFGAAVIADVADNVITFGSEYVFDSDIVACLSAAGLDSGKFIIFYEDYGTTKFGTAMTATVSGNVISFGLGYIFHHSETIWISKPPAIFSSTQYVVTFTDYLNSYKGTAVVGTVDGTAAINNTKGYAIGVAKSAGTAGQSVQIIISGISDIHSGLTAGSVYYANRDGTLTATATAIRVGLALSSTEILLNSNRDNTSQFF